MPDGSLCKPPLSWEVGCWFLRCVWAGQTSASCDLRCSRLQVVCVPRMGSGGEAQVCGSELAALPVAHHLQQHYPPSDPWARQIAERPSPYRQASLRVPSASLGKSDGAGVASAGCRKAVGGGLPNVSRRLLSVRNAAGRVARRRCRKA